MRAPVFRWVVGESERLDLAELLTRSGLGGALSEGRAFVNGERASLDAARLPEGAVIEVFARRPSAEIAILFEQAGVIAVSKPAALPTEPDHAGADSVLAQLAVALCRPMSELHAVSRLDVGVSGVLLVASDARSRATLLSLKEQGLYERRYVALASGALSPAEGEWNLALGAGARGRRVVRADSQGRAASTRYRVVGVARPVSGVAPPTSLLALSPVTGRTHQLRVHASAQGAPLLGDRKYGGPARMTAGDGSVSLFPQIMLHAAWVAWGAEGRTQRVRAEPCAALDEAWLALGGDSRELLGALD